MRKHGVSSNWLWQLARGTKVLFTPLCAKPAGPDWNEKMMIHVAILAITTTGWPAAFAAMTWIEETLQAKRSKGER